MINITNMIYNNYDDKYDKYVIDIIIDNYIDNTYGDSIY